MNLCPATACVYIYYLLFAYKLVQKSLDDNLEVKLKYTAHCLPVCLSVYCLTNQFGMLQNYKSTMSRTFTPCCDRPVPTHRLCSQHFQSRKTLSTRNLGRSPSLVLSSSLFLCSRNVLLIHLNVEGHAVMVSETWLVPQSTIQYDNTTLTPSPLAEAGGS